MRTPLGIAKSCFSWRALLLSCLMLVGAGCGQQLDTEYGTRSAIFGDSVNGTHVFSQMFTDYGHRVVSWPALTPRLSEKADVIVWFSKSCDPPPPNVREWLEHWLFESPGRTVIYVGRDFDAAIPYLERVKKGPPPLAAAQLAEIDGLLAAESSLFNLQRAKASGGDGDWFSIDMKQQPKTVNKLNGSVEWVTGLQGAKLDVQLLGRMRPGVDVDVLLEDDQKNMILGEIAYDESRILLVPNGSYLLNLQLVNQENRKLAGRIVNSVGEDCYVVFLESNGDVPEVLDKDPVAQIPSLGRILAQPPLNTIVFHVMLAGLLLVFVRLPIFGIPKTLATTALSDFGRHVTALGELLMLTGDRQFAVGRVLHYQQVSRKQNEPMKLEHVADAPRLKMPTTPPTRDGT